MHNAMRTPLLALLVVVPLIGAGCYGSQTANIDLGSASENIGINASAGANIPQAVLLNVNSSASGDASGDAGTPAAQPGALKSFVITAHQFAFEPSEVRVKLGDRVKVSVTSTDVNHGFALPTFNVSEQLLPGKTVTVEFTADKQGTFPFFCTVFCGSGHADMHGQLVVE